jgi:TorA maturation chaperone TorD
MSRIGQASVVERSHVYALLASVFRAPLDGAQLQRLRMPEMLAALAAADVDVGEDFATGDAKAVLDSLAIDYTQLFHGPIARIAPYEGMQTEKDAQLMGAAAHAVRAFLAEAGFEVLREGGEFPDHVSVELAFMSELAQRAGDAAEVGDAIVMEKAVSLQRRFLAEHLGRWAGRFAGDVSGTATTPFYRGMADLLAAFIADETESVVA